MKSPASINPNLRYAPRGLPTTDELLLELSGDKARLQTYPADERGRGSKTRLQSSNPDKNQQTAALSRAITLLESKTADHRAWSVELIKKIRAAGLSEKSFRLGISGSPGVGKSTFIEAFGLELIKQGHRVAVLAVDPSSQLSGGSILGDKTRMEKLGHHPDAFIRPSPSDGFLGGVSRVTRESILLCEAAGFDYILVETVGVGQSEMAVHSMTDAFLLLSQPGAGDELQGIKRGILEMADLLVVNKKDLLPAAAKRTAGELRRSLHLAPARSNNWTPPVMLTAALKNDCIYEVYQSVEKYRSLVIQTGELTVKRKEQQKHWLREIVQSELLARLDRSEKTNELWTEMARKIDRGADDIHQFASEILRTFLTTKRTH